MFTFGLVVRYFGGIFRLTIANTDSVCSPGLLGVKMSSKGTEVILFTHTHTQWLSLSPSNHCNSVNCVCHRFVCGHGAEDLASVE